MKMEKASLFIICFLCVIVFCNGIETPQFTVIHTESDFEYIVRYIVPMEFHGVAPRPSADLNLQFLKWISHCVAVRKFSGFAADNNINKEVESLVNSLGKLQLGDSVALNKHQYSIAQYNASTHTVGCLNEVWMDVGSAFIKEGCRIVDVYGMELGGYCTCNCLLIIHELNTFVKIDSNETPESNPSVVCTITHQRLFQYIQGANLNNSRILMTSPVLTSIVPGAGPLQSSAYFVRFYLPLNHCIAVRKFSGFARDHNVIKEAEKLGVSLSRTKWANSTSSESNYAYSIAQYSSPFQFKRRVNEVWVDLEGSKAEGCHYNSLAAY
ncbi:hypothetical protein MKX03_037510 [Papaver bracteatum]|nr:hypothetical protein MKX03_037510 [Papaver bracteatum]